VGTNTHLIGSAKNIYSSKNHLKREQINKTEKGTVFRKDFLEGL
jgi:hypothetical protein